MSHLVMLRHGLSQWNIENRFTGWVDVPLAEEGKAQARDAAKLLQEYNFHVAYTSHLNRAIDTLDIVLDEMKHPKLEIIRDGSLNERNYGDLQGKNKNEIRRIYGEELFQLWRRSYSGKPPGGESLQDTAQRTLPYFQDKIIPQLDAGKNVLLVAHGNTLRAVIMELEGITSENIPKLEIGYCVPLIYERKEGKFRKAD